MKTTKTQLKSAAIGAVTVMLLAACGSGTADTATVTETDTVDVVADGNAGGGDHVTLEYWMWDDTQRPLYEKCAALFTAENPNIDVNITATIWPQYWPNLTTQMTAGTAPDVFVNHIVYLNQFANTHQLADLDEIGATEGVDFDLFMPGLAENWMVDGHRYGMPKDWDTMGFVYNVAAAEAAGYTPEQINSLTFDANGGTFGDFLKALTLDANGNNALSPDFDSHNVVRYGFLPVWDNEGAAGQNSWGNLAHALGWTVKNADGSLNYDSQALADTVSWYRAMVDAGVTPAFDATSTLGPVTVLENQDAASTFAGSWMVSEYIGENRPVEFAFAKVPSGPAGRFAATNGIADSIWAGTHHPAEAAKWVAFMATPACQNVVGDVGQIFPAIQSGTDAAIAARQAQGLDSSMFTDVAERGETFMLPAFNRSAEVASAVQDGLMSIANGADIQSTLADIQRTVTGLEH